MSDFIVSLIRTVVPVVVGSLIGWLVTAGIVLPDHATDSLILGINALCIALYYAGARWLEARWPAFGYLLGSRQEPTYHAPTTDLTYDEAALIRDLRLTEGRDEDTGR